MNGTNFHQLPVSPTGGLTTFIPFTPPMTSETTTEVKKDTCRKQLHHIATVRQNQGVSLANCAKRLGIPLKEARRQEDPTTDLTLSQLMAWKEVLDVPLSELVGPIEDELENPIRNRAMLLKVMKSAKQILQFTRENRIRFMATNLVDQLVEMMPELKSVNAWPDVGQSHEGRDPGQVFFRRFDPEVSRQLEM